MFIVKPEYYLYEIKNSKNKYLFNFPYYNIKNDLLRFEKNKKYLDEKKIVEKN